MDIQLVRAEYSRQRSLLTRSFGYPVPAAHGTNLGGSLSLLQSYPHFQLRAGRAFAARKLAKSLAPAAVRFC